MLHTRVSILVKRLYVSHHSTESFYVPASDRSCSGRYRGTWPGSQGSGRREYGSSQCPQSGCRLAEAAGVAQTYWISERFRNSTGQCCEREHRPSARRRTSGWSAKKSSDTHDAPHRPCPGAQSTPCTSCHARSSGHRSQSCSKSGTGCTRAPSHARARPS